MSGPLAVRLPNWVGDVCMALPALRRLAAAGRELRLVGRGWAADLLAGAPWPVRGLPRDRAAARAVLRGCGAREILLLTNSFSSAWQARRAGLAATGRRGDWRSWLLARAVPPLRGRHEVEVFLRLAEALLGVPAAAPEPELALPLAEAHRAAAAAALGAAGVDGRYTVLAPLAAGTVGGREKRWPTFPLLCRMLVSAGERVVACPGPGEEEAAALALPGAVLVPGLGLGAYAAVCAGARVVVANDSGPMHLAAAVGAPVVGVFGVSDPARTRPWSPRSRAVGSAAGWPALKAVWEAQDALAPLRRA